jgi:hypothetical protein
LTHALRRLGCGARLGSAAKEPGCTRSGSDRPAGNVLSARQILVGLPVFAGDHGGLGAAVVLGLRFPPLSAVLVIASLGLQTRAPRWRDARGPRRPSPACAAAPRAHQRPARINTFIAAPSAHGRGFAGHGVVTRG